MIRRSVSLYSYQDEYYDGKLDLEGCLRETAAAGADGVELLPEQMIRQFPDTVYTEAFIEKWNTWLERWDLRPSCYDAFLENRIYDNRMLTIKEQVQMMRRDLECAARMGFPCIRTLVSTPIPVIEESLSYAEEAGVRIGLEVHAPFSLNSTWAEDYLERLDKSGSKYAYFGFIPDMGIFCRRIPDVVEDKWRRAGASEEAVRMINEAFVSRVKNGFTKIEYSLDLGKANMEYRIANGFADLTEKLQDMQASKADFGYLDASYKYSWSDPKDLSDNISHILHVHAKCYNTHEDLTETAVALPEVIQALYRAGYDGYLSTEYEGGESLRDALPVDGIGQVQRHQEAMRRIIAEQAQGEITE